MGLTATLSLSSTLLVGLAAMVYLEWVGLRRGAVEHAMLASGPKDFSFHYNEAVVISFALGDGASKLSSGLKTKPKYVIWFLTSQEGRYKSVHSSVFYFLVKDSELQKPLSLHIVTKKFAF